MTAENPLFNLSPLPRFDLIRPEHVAPAIDALLAKARAALVKEGMQINEISDAERQRMREKLQSVVAKYQKVVGEETAAEFFAAIAKAPK